MKVTGAPIAPIGDAIQGWPRTSNILSDLPKAIPSGSPFLLFWWTGLSSIMWQDGVATTVMSLWQLMSWTVMLGGMWCRVECVVVMDCFLHGLPIVGGGLSGDIGISWLLWRVGDCWAGGTSSREGVWGSWGVATWSWDCAWEWGTCGCSSSSRSGFAFGVCWATC